MTIQEIKALRSAITPGKWRRIPYVPTAERNIVYYIKSEEGEMIAPSPGAEDAAFIAQAPEIVDWLVGEVERLNELVKCHETGEWLTKEEERAVYKKMYNYHVCNTGCGLHCSQIPLNHAY